MSPVCDRKLLRARQSPRSSNTKIMALFINIPSHLPISSFICSLKGTEMDSRIRSHGAFRALHSQRSAWKTRSYFTRGTSYNPLVPHPKISGLHSPLISPRLLKHFGPISFQIEISHDVLLKCSPIYFLFGPQKSWCAYICSLPKTEDLFLM